MENKSELGVNVIIKKSEFPNVSPVSLYILKASSPSITRASDEASNLKFFRPIEVNKKMIARKPRTNDGLESMSLKKFCILNDYFLEQSGDFNITGFLSYSSIVNA
jgi:hypothetical protein